MLDLHLTVLRRLELITTWHDGQIHAGAGWRRKIRARLNNAQVILLLISPDFIASDYVYSTEMRRAITRHQAGEALVIPILLRPVDWAGMPFAQLQMLPTNVKPVTTWPNQDEAFQHITEEIRRSITQYRTRQAEKQTKQGWQAVSPQQIEPHIASPDQFLEAAQPHTLTPSVLRKRRHPFARIFSRRGALLFILLFLLLSSGASLLFTLAKHGMSLSQATPASTPAAAKTYPSYNSYNSYVQAQGIQSGFDAAHTGFNQYEHDLTAFNVRNLVESWIAQTGGSISSSPVVANNVVYVGSDDHKLYAFNASGCSSSPCQPLWTAQTGGTLVSSPAVVGSIVYIGSEDGKLYAFDVGRCHSSSCLPLWTAQVSMSITSAPTVANGVIYLNSEDGELYAFNAHGCPSSSCQPLWAAQPGGSITASPAVAHKRIYAGSDDGKLYVFDEQGCPQSPCQPLWTAQTGNAIEASPVVANNVVYVGSNDGRLYAFDARGCSRSPCQPLWTAQTGGFIMSSPAVAGNVVYVGPEGHTLDAFNADGCHLPPCQPLWTAQVGNIIPSPVVANGIVYVGSDNGKLYTFHLK